MCRPAASRTGDAGDSLAADITAGFRSMRVDEGSSGGGGSGAWGDSVSDKDSRDREPKPACERLCCQLTSALQSLLSLLL